VSRGSALYVEMIGMKYISCPSCNSQNRETDETCYSCGASLQGAPAPAPPASYGGSSAEYSPARPAVIQWYVAYCACMALLYLLCAIFGGFLLSVDLSSLNLDRDLTEVKIQAVILLIIGVPLLIIYAIAPFLPRKPWNWITGIVLICLSMTSCCCLPASIPLLIHWIRPECKDYFQAR